MANGPAVSGVELWRHLEQIASTVRLSGTPGEAAAFDYAERELRGFGYDVRRYEAEALIGYPQRSRLELLSPERDEIACNGYALTLVTVEEGVIGELIHVGSSLSTSYDGYHARGKIVVVDGVAIEDAALAAARAGAIGQIFVNPDHIHEMCISPVWGTPTPETAHLLPSVPAVAVDRRDGERLKMLMAREPVTVRLSTQPYRAWTAIPTLTADLPGQASDEFVLFSGHIDSWHHGAMDNGTANATQLEVGRLLAERRSELKRGVRIAFWSGHSHGRYAGSTWYADHFWQELHERCVCHVNVDSVGARGATILDGTSSMASTYPFAAEVLRRQVGVDLKYHRKGRSSDQSFWGHGVPAMFGALSLRPGAGEDAAVAEIFGGVSLGWWWHTTEDLIDKIDPEFLVRDAAIYAETLSRLCGEERLPFQPAAEAEEIANALHHYHNAAGGALDLARTAEMARDAAGAIRGAALDRRGAVEANGLAMALCRELIPVNYTKHGPFHHDLAVETKPVPGLAPAIQLAALDRNGDDWHFLLAVLVRERNRVEHALLRAQRLVEAK
jgi:hypothetical protein